MHSVNKNVPMPKAERTAPPRRIYPFRTMAVGDMFFVANRTKNNLSTHASTVGKQIGYKFNTRLTYMRKVKDNWVLCESDDAGATQGIGVWRVK